VVNDRLDVALACGAGGVHLRSDSISPTAARSIAPEGFLVGRSIHSVAEAEAYASSADYFIAGTVYPTASKPGQPRLLGPAGLAAIVRATSVPVLGIGGVTAGNLDKVVASGAAGIAAIGLFLSAPIAEAVASIRAAFDITKAAS
jgi:thiamine-phosphate diphosphorylase